MNNPVECPVCGNSMPLAGDAAYYDQVSRWRTPVYYCAACDLFYRVVEDRRLVSHYHAASYVQDKNEEHLLRSRIGFFRWILSLIRDYDRDSAAPSRRTSLLDFGSAYGHLLGLAQEQGFDPTGIELNENLVRTCREKGLTVYKGLDEFSGKVDVITAIDSLYCVSRPKELLTDLRRRLNPGGLLLVRITNRNLHARWRSRFPGSGDLSAIGDATVSYSARGLRRLLSLTGFRVQKVIPDHGQGKKLGVRKRLLYTLTYVLTLAVMKRCVLTPGIVVLATVDTNSGLSPGSTAPSPAAAK
jgi:SAM-dependent methyltransferase